MKLLLHLNSGISAVCQVVDIFLCLLDHLWNNATLMNFRIQFHIKSVRRFLSALTWPALLEAVLWGFLSEFMEHIVTRRTVFEGTNEPCPSSFSSENRVWLKSFVVRQIGICKKKCSPLRRWVRKVRTFSRALSQWFSYYQRCRREFWSLLNWGVHWQAVRGRNGHYIIMGIKKPQRKDGSFCARVNRCPFGR